MVPAAAKRTTSQYNGSQHEAEIVPVAAVVDFVDVHVVIEERDDERNRRDDPMPQALPETGDDTARSGSARDAVRPGDATGEEEGEGSEDEDG